MTDLIDKIIVSRCPCGQPSCSTWQLSGIGHFHIGSGFSLEEATVIADRYNAHADLVAALLAIRGSATSIANPLKNVREISQREIIGWSTAALAKVGGAK